MGAGASASPLGASVPAGSPAGGASAAPRPSLFEKGYNDKILLRPGQLDNWKRYLDDNPRRLAIKRQCPDYFTIMQHITIGEWSCQMVGNRFLLTVPDCAAVIVHHADSDQEFAQKKARWLALGEMGGVLDEVLDRLAQFMEKDFALKKKVKAALTYPVVILVMAIGIVFFLVTYILPTFVSMFEGMNLQLPLPTRILMTVTKLAQEPVYLGIFAASIVALFIILKKYVETPVGRKQFDQLKLSVPVFGLLNKKVAISRFCRTLGTLLSSGVPIMQSLEIVGKASGNEVIAATVTRVRDSIREGESIAAPLGASGMFPPMVTQMVAVGEETGNLDAMLSKIADFYDTEVDYLLSSLTSMLEPIMIVGMGGIVGFIVISVFMPMYQLVGSMS